jgi:2-C-methyl-D-erythritol 2,4-cyclodiphosphate synthase
MSMAMRVGYGFDVHRFSDDPSRELVMGGVVIDGFPGLVGHSDADVITHAVVDALLGAANLGDIGQHFADTDERWRGASSSLFLAEAVRMVRDEGWQIQNVDCAVVTEQPKIAPHRSAMQAHLSGLVGAPVSVKASRAEGLGALGRVEGAACWAVSMLSKEE